MLNKVDEKKLYVHGEHRPDLFSHHILNRETNEVKAIISSVPINYRNGNDYSACDLVIVKERNWEFEYVVRKNNFTAYFNDSTDSINPSLASFEIKNGQGIGRWINFKLFGANPLAGVPTGNRILYVDCFENIDLEYIVDTWRLKENITIKADIENHKEFTFTLKLDGCRLERQSDGGVLFLDVDTHETLWRIDPPYLQDAADKRSTAVEYHLGKVTYLGVEYDSISVVVLEQYFSDWVYPIVIDPTTSFTISSSISRGIVGRDGSNASYPPGGTTQVYVGSDVQVGRVTKENDTGARVSVWNSFFSFDTSSIPDACTLTSATLRLTCASISGGSSTRNMLGDYNYYTNESTSLYSYSISGTAFAYPLVSITSGLTFYVTLSNVNSAISKTANTGFLLGISGGAPATNEYHCRYIYLRGTAAENPQLSVTYVTTFAGKVIGISAPKKIMSTDAKKIIGIG